MLDIKTKETIMKYDKVIAVGEGIKIKNGIPYKDKVASVSVDTKLPEAQLFPYQIIPKEINGIPTDVVESHIIKAQARTDYIRPAPGGVSIGHGDITAGTLGWVLEHNGELKMLSNNHVFANSNDGEINDAIYQPGPYDWSSAPSEVSNEKYRLAWLSNFVEIKFQEDGGGDIPSECPIGRGYAGIGNLFAKMAGSDVRVKAIVPSANVQEIPINYVDAALAIPDNPGDVVPGIIDIGMITGIAETGIGKLIKKSGRTTGHTTGTVSQVNVMVDVSYGVGKVARFDEQIMTTAMSQGGDSGSLGVDPDNNAVALLYAGSDQVTIFNPIMLVLDALGIGGLF